jgi:hypothetical protein
VLAFEVKGERFDLERALKQSADYVGARVLGGPHKDKKVAACFLYPEREFHQFVTHESQILNGDVVGHHPADWRSDGMRRGMFNLIAQWRVGRAFVDRYEELTLAFGYEAIWRNRRGWVEGRAWPMLVGKRSVGGSRREPDDTVGERVIPLLFASPEPTPMTRRVFT